MSEQDEERESTEEGIMRDLPEEDMTVDLELDTGTVTCTVVTIFSVEGKDYIALLPKEAEDEENGNVWIYGYAEDPENADAEPTLRYIDDEKEYEAAADAFDQYLDECEFDELS